MSVVGYLAKEEEATVQTQKGGSYKYEYISADQVAAAIRPACIRYGIGIWPTVVSHTKDGNRTELSVQVSFVNIHKIDEKVDVNVVAYGVDNSDKGPGKALTYAVKYACMKLFQLNSHDDIEADDIEHDPAQPRASEVTAAEVQATEAMHAWAETYKSALESATTIEELMEVQRKNARALASDRLPEILHKMLVGIGKKRKSELQEQEAA